MAVHGLYGQYTAVFDHRFADVVQVIGTLVGVQGRNETLPDLSLDLLHLPADGEEFVGGLVPYLPETVDHRIDVGRYFGIGLHAFGGSEEQGIVLLELFEELLQFVHGKADAAYFSKTSDLKNRIFDAHQLQFLVDTVEAVGGNAVFADKGAKVLGRLAQVFHHLFLIRKGEQLQGPCLAQLGTATGRDLLQDDGEFQVL